MYYEAKICNYAETVFLSKLSSHIIVKFSSYLIKSVVDPFLLLSQTRSYLCEKIKILPFLQAFLTRFTL